MTYPHKCPGCGHVLVERRPLTKTEVALFKVLCRFDSQPTFEKIGQAMGWSSLSTVHEYMHKLARKGYLRFDDDLRVHRGPGAGWEIVT